MRSFRSAIALLRCPVCSGPLHDEGREPEPSGATAKRLVCPAGHSFDAARQGYFNFLVGRGTAFEADTADMAAARADFLAAEHYLPLAEKLAAAVVRSLPGGHFTVLDSGTGTGHYLRVLLNSAAAQGLEVSALGLDISKFALRRASRLNPDAVNLVWDVWRPLPVADRSIDVVTVVFAPRNPAEFARVLKDSGRLVVVTPRPGHLAAVAEITGMLSIGEDKESRLAAALEGHFSADNEYDVDIPLTLTRREAVNLAFMGPAGHHVGRESLAARLAEHQEPLRTDARFRISVFRPQSS